MKTIVIVISLLVLGTSARYTKRQSGLPSLQEIQQFFQSLGFQIPASHFQFPSGLQFPGQLGGGLGGLGQPGGGLGGLGGGFGGQSPGQLGGGLGGQNPGQLGGGLGGQNPGQLGGGLGGQSSSGSRPPLNGVGGGFPSLQTPRHTKRQSGLPSLQEIQKWFQSLGLQIPANSQFQLPSGFQFPGQLGSGLGGQSPGQLGGGLGGQFPGQLGSGLGGQSSSGSRPPLNGVGGGFPSIPRQLDDEESARCNGRPGRPGRPNRPPTTTTTQEPSSSSTTTTTTEPTTTTLDPAPEP